MGICSSILVRKQNRGKKAEKEEKKYSAASLQWLRSTDQDGNYKEIPRWWWGQIVHYTMSSRERAQRRWERKAQVGETLEIIRRPVPWKKSLFFFGHSYFLPHNPVGLDIKQGEGEGDDALPVARGFLHAITHSERWRLIHGKKCFLFCSLTRVPLFLPP